ncbi:alcohol dehydrogenase catalytic domain-containing protein [Aquabacter cavernae]|uniref:alcohol dehydrogenase catalytic domain-containing protein n=1 Tax=Aquabacter cavernae TaxID=2496029 RepID=UPI000F8D571C|nr:alcohol dehydrogenase catalytic domain-containing protein [Aquabacter cavernae]
MKALVYTGPNRLELREAPEPVPGNDEVLVRVEAVGICGSDMHAYHGHDARRPAPLILGHEAAGRVATGPRAGERVTVNPLVTCGSCPSCEAGRPHLCASRQILSMPPRPGAFAELVRVPERNLVTVPEHFPMAHAALAEPVAVSYHAVKVGSRLLDCPLPAARCLVLGGGAIGLAAGLVLAMQGAAEIFVAEPHPGRRATVERAGRFLCYAPREAGEPDDGSMDLVIDAVGAVATRAAASRLVRPGGVIVHAGLLPGEDGFDVRRITLQEIIVTGTYCYTPADFRATVGALVSGRLGDLSWIEERDFADAVGAFADIDAGRTDAAKVVLRL